MSAEIPPDPVTDTFNPAAWNVPEFTPEEQALLDANFVKYPITQNNTITFPIAPIAPTLANGTNTTQVATTGFVQNAITAFLSTVNTWLGTQIFSVGMTSNTINPTTPSGTLTIGNAAANTNVEIATSASRNVILHLGDGDNNSGGIHIGNGATSANNVQILNGAGSTGTIFLGSATSTISLGCPLTPNYATVYSATGTGTDKIGQVIDATIPATVTYTPNVPITVYTISSLPIGVWIIAGSCGRGGGGSYTIIGFSTTTNSLTTGCFSQDVMVTGLNNAVNTMAYPFVNTIVQNIYLIGQSDASGSNTFLSASGYFRAVRIA
jgi:hypothetical protein